MAKSGMPQSPSWSPLDVSRKPGRVEQISHNTHHLSQMLEKPDYAFPCFSNLRDSVNENSPALWTTSKNCPHLFMPELKLPLCRRCGWNPMRFSWLKPYASKALCLMVVGSMKPWVPRESIEGTSVGFVSGLCWFTKSHSVQLVATGEQIMVDKHRPKNRRILLVLPCWKSRCWVWCWWESKWTPRFGATAYLNLPADRSSTVLTTYLATVCFWTSLLLRPSGTLLK